jgi:hypothetical protein
MVPGVPYIVTKGSSWAELRRGDRVKLLTRAESGCNCKTIQVMRKQVSHRWFTSSLGSWEVEIDRAGIMERVARMRADADALEGMLTA